MIGMMGAASPNDLFEYRGWKFYNFPKKLKLADYKSFENQIRKKISTFDTAGQVSVYEGHNLLSKTYSPGFSDIDLIVVADEIDDKLKKLFTAANYSGSNRDVFYHDALFLPLNLLKSYKITMEDHDYREI